MKKHTTLKAKFNSAFSLVELLVVIAVIAVIAAIAIPNIAGTKEAAEGAKNAYNTAEFERMSNQLTAMGYSGSMAGLTNGTGITVNITNGTNVSPVVFKADQ